MKKIDNEDQKVSVNERLESEGGSSGRRKLLTLAGVGIALTIPNRWVEPVVESVVLPAHAQVSVPPRRPPPQTIFEYFAVLQTDGSLPFPREMSVIVDTDTGLASVVAINRGNNVRPEITLNIDGTPSGVFSGTIDPACGGISLPLSTWFIDGYTAGDSTISVTTTGGGGWTVTLPLGSGTVKDTCV